MEEFDCRGKLSSLTLESVSVDPEEPDREEQRLLVAKLFYDSSGLLIRRQEPGKTVFFHYNEEGLLEKEVELRGRDQISREKSYRYAAGRLLEETGSGEKISYHYNSHDRLSYTTAWMGDIQESICSYGFNDEGRVILKEIRDNEGELLRRCRLGRNPQGLISEETTINQSGMLLEHCRYSYPVFHGENWLKRERWSLLHGEEPVLTEILYRNIALSSDAPSVNEEAPDREGPVSIPEEEAPETEDIEEAWPEEESPETAEEAPQKEIRFRNGQYRGQVDEEDRPHGTGEFWGRDGSRYSGSFLHGRMNGHGNLLHKNGSSYTGDFVDGFPQGEGECLWPDGSRYRGEFVRGEMHGIGSFTWAEGSRFTGLFEHNRSTDQGLLESVELPEALEAPAAHGEGQ